MDRTTTAKTDCFARGCFVPSPALESAGVEPDGALNEETHTSTGARSGLAPLKRQPRRVDQPVGVYKPTMRTGIFLSYADGFREAADRVVEFEKRGVDIALVAEAYSFDAISQLGYLAAKTSTIELGSGVVPIYVRTPTLLAMTAAGLDYVSDGRFRLGIGTSGPQVMEGFHGVPFDAPLGRTREVIEICRQVWRRENVSHDGKHYQIPLPADRGTGLGKPLHLINHPVRERIPITIAALGPKNVELTAEIAEGWQPVFFYPEKADAVWGDALRAGFAKRDATLGPLDVMVSASLAIGDDVEERLAWAKPQLALYIGGMGARGKNFYHNLATSYGFGEIANEIQDLYLAGKKTEAIAAVPDDLVRNTNLVGPRGFVKERLAAYAEAGVTTLVVHPFAADAAEQNRYVEELVTLVS
jgi:F420-dependent oxidoreductase-like protein